MIKLLNLDKVKDSLSSCRGNLGKIDIEKIMDDMHGDFFRSLVRSGSRKGFTYVYSSGLYSFWFRYEGKSYLRRGPVAQFPDYDITLTHICQKDEALLVL